MTGTNRYIAVDEYDNVVGYYATAEEAEQMAESECAEGCRDTYVYEIVPVNTFRFEEGSDGDV